MWDLSSLTRSQTWVPALEGGFLSTGPLGKSPVLVFAAATSYTTSIAYKNTTLSSSFVGQKCDTGIHLRHWPGCVPSLATFLICYKRGQLQLLATNCGKCSFHFILLQIFSNFPCSIQPSFKSGHLLSKYVEFLTLKKKWGGGLDLLPLRIPVNHKQIVTQLTLLLFGSDSC